jgi:hypothetical protein
MSANSDDWPDRQPPPVESAACFFGDCAHCPDPASCSHQCHRELKRQLLADIDNDGRYASLSAIRDAIFDVIDGGDPNMAGRIWFFYERINGMEVWDEDFANQQREGFVDAVCQRVKELQAPPFELDGELRQGMAKGKRG